MGLVMARGVAALAAEAEHFLTPITLQLLRALGTQWLLVLVAPPAQADSLILGALPEPPGAIEAQQVVVVVVLVDKPCLAQAVLVVVAGLELVVVARLEQAVVARVVILVKAAQVAGIQVAAGLLAQTAMAAAVVVVPQTTSAQMAAVAVAA